jgi:glycine/serine hydroxymethyltransferase
MVVTVKKDSREQEVSLKCSENPAIKKLLDAIVSILADEYIQTAKNNPEIFS